MKTTTTTPTTTKTTTSFSDVGALANSFAARLDRLAPLAASSPRRLLRLLRALHAHATTSGFSPRRHLFNRLLHLYANSGDLPAARRLFYSHPSPDVVARTSLLVAHARLGLLSHARHLFDEIPLPSRDPVSYNSIISAYSRSALPLPAIQLYRQMIIDGLCPDDYTFTGVLSAAAALPGIRLADCSQLHAAAVKYGAEPVVSVSNALVALYFACSSDDGRGAASARRVFEGMSAKDELTWTTMLVGYTRRGDVSSAWELFEGMSHRCDVVWNAMISGFVQQGRFSEAVELFRRMSLEEVPMDEFTFTSIISACASCGLVRDGKAVHGRIVRSAVLELGPSASSLPVENALVTFYCKSGDMEAAQRVFQRIRDKDEVSWNAILSGFVSVGEIGEAQRVFELMPGKNRVAWTVIISALAQNGLGEEGLRLFVSMKREGIEPCDFAISAALAASAMLGALELGCQLHGQLVRHGHDSSNSAGNSLVTMYARCGAMEAARQVFVDMPHTDSVSWNAMIAALGQHGHGPEAVELFEEMCQKGINPDRVSFLTILSACNHAGMVEEGKRIFKAMEEDHGLVPGEDHYGQMVDLLGRAGRLEEAMDFLNSLQFEPGPAIWEAILSSCRIHGAMDLGLKAADKLLEMSPRHDGAYALLANIYAGVRRWDDVARVRKMMKERQVRKEPGCSWVEVGGKVCVFMSGDTTHSEWAVIYRSLEVLGARMRKMGYVADTRFVLQDLEPRDRERTLNGHSERLAVAFGMMKLPAAAAVRVFKNLRICIDCHAAVTFMALAAGREVIVRDGRRFHHFKDGSCSCGNYWVIYNN
ncbi:pentatricopeptide repeat (PPR) superfamily protein isoform X2 [Wolffia australiana]